MGKGNADFFYLGCDQIDTFHLISEKKPTRSAELSSETRKIYIKNTYVCSIGFNE